MFCTTGRPQSRPRSPRIVPGSAAVGSVAPASERKPSIDAVTLGDQRDDRAGRHELDQRLVERLADVLGVVLGEQLGGGYAHVERDEPIALGLDAPDHLTDEPAGHPVGLDEDQRAFGRRGVHARQRNGKLAQEISMRAPPGVPARSWRKLSR